MMKRATGAALVVVVVGAMLVASPRPAGANVAPPWTLTPTRRHVVASLDLGEPRQLARSGFQIKLAAVARARLVFAGQIDPVYHQNPSVYSGFAIPAHNTRHVALATPEDR